MELVNQVKPGLVRLKLRICYAYTTHMLKRIFIFSLGTNDYVIRTSVDHSPCMLYYSAVEPSRCMRYQFVLYCAINMDFHLVLCQYLYFQEGIIQIEFS